ncbi:hypothetical protein [Maribacter sp. 2210JD10-5]|uniref:hypothetical protein n=1 Tax=Maribacter sp. 2210JD10-5 TaxID=3386272 RepID=UPI0039BC7DA4
MQKIELKNFFDKSMNLEISSHALLSNYSIIMFSSFIEEYDKYFNPGHLSAVDSRRILNVKEKNLPGLKRIRKWKDISRFRNHMVAHSFRFKNKSFFSDEIEELNFKIPNKISEKNLFAGIVHLICMNIRDEFLEYVINFDNNQVMLDKMKLMGEDIDNEKELIELYARMRG